MIMSGPGGALSARGFLPALPALVLLLAFFLFPVVRMLGFSVEAGTLDWYAKALGEGLYLRVFWNTFEIALLVTGFCLLLGYPLGFLIATTTPGWATLGFIFVLLPLWTSVLVRTYAWMVLLGPQRRVQPLADRWRDHQRPAAAAAQFHRRADRHGACPAALHGAADLRRGAPARSRHRRRRRRGSAPRTGASSGASTFRSP